LSNVGALMVHTTRAIASIAAEMRGLICFIDVVLGKSRVKEM
jgi:hypothetical protein